MQGQDKVYKDVIEPLESVSVNSIPTSKEDIRDLGPPDKVNFTISLTFFLKKKHKNWASPSGRGPFRSIIITPILQVAEALIKKVLAPPTQKTKLIEAKEVCLDNRHA